VGFHGDLDIAGPAHKKGNLPPDLASAMKVVEAVGLPPTCVVNSGHGLQPHWLLTEPFVFLGQASRKRAAELASRFQQTLAAAAQSAGGWQNDSVGDLARILRFPGTLNHKMDVVSVELVDGGGPRFDLADIESVLVDSTMQPATVHEPAAGALGYPGSDDELLAIAGAAKNGSRFADVFHDGSLEHHGGDHSAADLFLAGVLAFWCGPDRVRIDRLFRRSKLFRPKWDEIHQADGRTYGRMTVDKALEGRTEFYQLRSGLPVVIVTGNQLREQTDDAIAALEAINNPPVLFQRGADIVRIRVDAASGESVLERVTADAMVGLLTRSADYFRRAGPRLVPVRPPKAIAADILNLPAWRFPPLVGVVEYPRIRPDGTLLIRPGYDELTKLWLAEYEGWDGFDVPVDPTDEDVRQALALIDELLEGFPFADKASRANAYGFMLTPLVRHAISGRVPVCAFDAHSKQGTGKSLLCRSTMIAVCGREVSMNAIPSDEPEWRKSLTALLDAGREVIAFDNATGLFIESGVWANAITSPVFEDRILGLTKRGRYCVTCTWGITGNGLTFGGDLSRRVYLVMLDARCERPEDRTGFRHTLPDWALENRLPLLRACMILCRRWWSDGCPAPRIATWGSFEEWLRVVGGVLHNAGVEGFLDNRAEFRDAADTDRAEWTGFVEALADAFPGGAQFASATVTEEFEQRPALRDAVPDHLRAYVGDAKFTQKLGWALRKKAGAVFGRFRLDRVGVQGHSKKPHYRITEHALAGKAGTCGEDFRPTRYNDEVAPF
jgi:hypothetical protein